MKSRLPQEQPHSGPEKAEAGNLGLGSHTLADIKQTLLSGKDSNESGETNPQSDYPKTFEGKRQELADNFGKLGGLYGVVRSDAETNASAEVIKMV